ncbi:trypsin-like serine peptidase [Antarctobacter sp.]|uniref:trypsin-like serine peptidase n=1 Tax=Antarctobacter sp. TaxID=1872577 RepID=UPI002B2715FA|nr:trypsin-like peptidase domain-containing protein [Antarctobacter sp.]
MTFLARLTTCLCLAAPTAFAQDLPLGPRSDFGKVVLTDTQAAGGDGPITLEQMIGGAFDSEPAYLYPEVSGYRKLGRAVGRLNVLSSLGTGVCTAFIISDTHLMTNGHCFDHKGETIQAVSFIAGYVETGIKEGTMTYAVNPVPLELSESDDLDYAILEVFGKPSREWGELPLSAFAFDAEAHVGLPLIIIGHPARMAQHISRKDCRVAQRNPLAENRLRHTCDTLGGNSGSPVIGADDRKVIALHHAGDAKNGVNFAVPIALIAERSAIVAKLLDRPAPKPDTVNADLAEQMAALAKQAEDAREARETAAAQLAALVARQAEATESAEQARRAMDAYRQALAEQDLDARITLLQAVSDEFSGTVAADLAVGSIGDARRTLDQRAEQVAAIAGAKAAEDERKRLAQEKTELLKALEEARALAKAKSDASGLRHPLLELSAQSGQDRNTLLTKVWASQKSNISKLYMARTVVAARGDEVAIERLLDAATARLQKTADNDN